MNRVKVDGVDYSPEGIAALREELIDVQRQSMNQWPEAIPFTILMTHTIALLSDYKEMREAEDFKEVR